MKTVTSATIVRVLEGIFGRLGLPYSLRSDNGSQFVSDAIQNFLRDNGVKHRRITPLASWQMENASDTTVRWWKQSASHTLREKIGGVSWPSFLIAHRSSPHCSTGATPFFLMYGCETRTKLPDLCRERTVLDETTRDKDWANKLKGKA